MAVQWPLLIFSVLLGVTSGSFVFIGVGEFMGKFKEVRFTGVLIALACLVIGGIASAFHLGHPERATHLLGNLGSGLTKELAAVVVMAIVAIAYAVLVRKDYPAARKALGIAGAVAGVALPIIAGASYLMAARPAWDSATLPLMYLGGGLGSGMTLMAALVLAKGDASPSDEQKLAVKLAIAGMVVLVVLSLAYVAWIGLAPHQADSRSIGRLMAGDLAFAFWLGVVGVGLAAPCILAGLAWKTMGGPVAAAARRASSYLFAACACSVVGAVVLRVIMYAVGTSVEAFIYR